LSKVPTKPADRLVNHDLTDTEALMIQGVCLHQRQTARKRSAVDLALDRKSSVFWWVCELYPGDLRHS